MDPWPPEDGVVGRFGIEDAELRDDVVWIRSNRELDCSERTGFAPVESIEKRLDLRDDHFLGKLGSGLHSISVMSVHDVDTASPVNQYL